MTVIKRIGILSLAKLMAIISAFFGLIIGIIIAFVAGVIGTFGGMPLWFRGIGLGAIVLFPLAYGAIGFVYGAIIAALYNAAARIVGGLELEIG